MDPNNRFSDADLARLFDLPETEISAMHPVDLWIPREQLKAAVRRAIAKLTPAFTTITDDPLKARYTHTVLQQLRDALERLHASAEEYELISFYFSRDDIFEDVIDPLTNEDERREPPRDDDLPF